MWKAGMGLRGQGQFPPGRSGGWAATFQGAGMPYSKSLAAGPVSALGENWLFPFRLPEAKKL